MYRCNPLPEMFSEYIQLSDQAECKVVAIDDNNGDKLIKLINSKTYDVFWIMSTSFWTQFTKKVDENQALKDYCKASGFVWRDEIKY